MRVCMCVCVCGCAVRVCVLHLVAAVLIVFRIQVAVKMASASIAASGNVLSLRTALSLSLVPPSATSALHCSGSLRCIRKVDVTLWAIYCFCVESVKWNKFCTNTHTHTHSFSRSLSLAHMLLGLPRPFTNATAYFLGAARHKVPSSLPRS